MNSTLQNHDQIILTHTAVLRIGCALFSLVPSIFNIIAPQDFLALLPSDSESFAYQKDIFTVSVYCQFIASIGLLIGYNTRVCILLMIFFVLPVQAYFVSFDELSSLRELSISGFVMLGGLHAALFFLGNGRFAVQGGGDILLRVANWDGGIVRRWLYVWLSPRGRNIGIILLRISAALPLLVASLLGLILERAAFLSDYDSVNALFGLSALVASLSLISGFKIRSLVWLVFGLLCFNLFFVAIPEINISQIGLINIEFHVILLLSLYAARFLEFGSDLERQHILNSDKKKIVIIGGGFAGTSLARHLESIIASDYQVVLISEENYTTFNPMLAEVVGASVMPSHVLAPIRRMLRRTVFIMGTVVGVRSSERKITYRCSSGEHCIIYEHVVFALGARANLDIMAGMREHAYPLKMLGDALVLRNRVIEQLEKLDNSGGGDSLAGHFIIVGGGFSGIEVAGSLHDFVISASRFYPRISVSDLRVSVVHSGDLPLPELPSSLGRHSLAAMRRKGIEFHLGVRVQSAESDGITLGDGSMIKGGTIICTIGSQPNPLVLGCSDLSQERGRLVVESDMRVRGCDNIWAIGDCAFVSNLASGDLSPPTAQFAVAQGEQLAYNIRCSLEGRVTCGFSLHAKGMMAVIGHLDGVALIGGVKISGFWGWLLWRCFYLLLMPTAAKKTRIAFEWLWSMLFSADIVNLRFTRTGNVDLDLGGDVGKLD